MKAELNTRATPVVKMELVRLFCMTCTDGEMKPTGLSLMSSPPQHVMRCSKCGDEYSVIGKHYPRLEFEAEDGTRFTL